VTSVWHKVAYDSKLKELDLEVKAQEDRDDDSDYDNEDEEGTEKLKEKIIELSIRYQVLSDYTSFLAVLEESTVDPSEGRVRKIIRNLNSADYSSKIRASVHSHQPSGTVFYSMVADPSEFGTGSQIESANSLVSMDFSLAANGANTPASGSADASESVELAITIRVIQPEFSRDPEDLSEKLAKALSFAGLIVGGLFLGYLRFLSLRGSQKSESEDDRKEE